MASIKSDMEKFDGKVNLSNWQASSGMRMNTGRQSIVLSLTVRVRVEEVLDSD